MFERGQTAESCDYFRLAQQICRSTPLPYSTRVLKLLRDTFNCLGTALAELNDPAACLANQRAWMDMMMERRGEDGVRIVDYELAQAYNELGVAYACNQLWDDAVPCFEKSMDVVSQQPSFEEFHLGWGAPNLGFMYWILGRLEAAERLFYRILKIYEDKFGKDDLNSFKYGVHLSSSLHLD